MTHEIPLEGAADQLSALVSEALSGVEVVFLQNDLPVAKLVSTVPTEPRRPRQFGSAKGLIRMSPDFDEPLDEFAEYM